MGGRVRPARKRVKGDFLGNRKWECGMRNQARKAAICRRFRLPHFTPWLVIAPPARRRPSRGASATGRRTPLCSGYTNSHGRSGRHLRRRRSGNRTSWLVALAKKRSVEKSLPRQVYAKIRGGRATQLREEAMRLGSTPITTHREAIWDLAWQVRALGPAQDALPADTAEQGRCCRTPTRSAGELRPP